MLYKYSCFRKSKTKQNVLYSAPHVKSSVKLDSFLNFSKISNDSLNSIHTDNNNNIIIEPINKQKPKNKHSSIQKSKKESINKNKKFHKHASCVDDFNNTINKSKSALSQYILTNTSTKSDFCYPNIKLLGNSRYKYTSPIMFVEDQKNNVSNNNLDLVPIPMERCKVEMTEKEENERGKKLYNLQRSIVMLRRKQYNIAADKKKLRNQFIDYNSNSYKNEIDDISEYINKIVLIQKWWNNFSKKNEMKNKINKFGKKLRCFVGEIILNKLKMYLTKYQKPINLLCYINKIRKRYLYKEIIKENIIKNKDENSLNSVEINENLINSNKKEPNLNSLVIKDINSNNENELFNNLEKENNIKSHLKNQFGKSNYENEYIENIKNELNNNSQINENNDLINNDDYKNSKIKNIEIKDNNIGSKNDQDKNINYLGKYNYENLTTFSDYIKKIFLSQLIDKIKENDDLPAINIYKVKQCFISKIVIDKKSLLYKNNYVPFESNNNIIKMNKTDLRVGFFFSKIILKQEIDNIIKIQKYIKEKNKAKEKEIKAKNNFVYKRMEKKPCCINKIRKYNYIKLINVIQKTFKAHISNNINKNEIIIKKPLCTNYNDITKKRFVVLNKKINNNKNNLNYLILLLNIFIKKNIQEYIFQIFKTRKTDLLSSNKSYFPFYLRTIQRITNYVQKSENPNKKISLFFKEIFKHQKTKVISVLKEVCFLLEKNKNKLINSNIFTGYEENDLINFLSDFSEFDKNLNNETFIIERLKRTKLNDTNIFTLVKIIDNEYKNLVKGLYCFECYNEINLCNCIKKKKSKETNIYLSNNYQSRSNDKSSDNLNFDDLSDEADNRRQIHFFDYNKDGKDDNNILIKTKIANNDNDNQKLIDIILPENNYDDK